jgi:hypothetical protein
MVAVHLTKRVFKMEQIIKLRERAGSKNDYRPKTLEEVRDDFIRRAKETVVALREKKVRPYHPAPMARQQTKTQMYCVKIGYGGNNAYMPNPVHKTSQVLKYSSAEEAASDIETIIIQAAKAGEFDDGLKTVLEQHKRLAKRRMEVMSANAKAALGSSDGHSTTVAAQAAD